MVLACDHYKCAVCCAVLCCIMDCTVLCCAVLWTVLCCAVLYYVLYCTVYDIIFQIVAAHPRKVAFVDIETKREYTFVQIEELSNQFANYFLVSLASIYDCLWCVPLLLYLY